MKNLNKKEIDKIRKNPDKVNWDKFSYTQKLSEDFIREFKDKVSWDNISYKQKLSEDFIREFKDKVDWVYISYCQKLSEDFIREFQDKVNWNYIASSQHLSEDFIREFKNKVNWSDIAISQNLSESFIRAFKDKVDWYNISCTQNLSESFIGEFKNKVSWNYISYSQPWNNFSKEFKQEFKDKLIHPENHIQKTDKEKLKQIKAYAKKYKLKFDGKYLYAFRNHDAWGRGLYNSTIFYIKGKTYWDWHCDMNPKNENSFGLGIFPKGNTKVKVHYQDWGVEVNRKDGKARVWAFTLV